MKKARVMLIRTESSSPAPADLLTGINPMRAYRCRLGAEALIRRPNYGIVTSDMTPKRLVAAKRIDRADRRIGSSWASWPAATAGFTTNVSANRAGAVFPYIDARPQE